MTSLSLLAGRTVGGKLLIQNVFIKVCNCIEKSHKILTHKVLINTAADDNFDIYISLYNFIKNKA